jgi:hypothetical protein
MKILKGNGNAGERTWNQPSRCCRFQVPILLKAASLKVSKQKGDRAQRVAAQIAHDKLRKRTLHRCGDSMRT